MPLAAPLPILSPATAAAPVAPGSAFSEPGGGGTPNDPVHLRGVVSPSHTGDYTLIRAGFSALQPAWSLDGTQGGGGNIILIRAGGGWTIVANNAVGSAPSQWAYMVTVTPAQADNPRGLAFSPVAGAAAGTITAQAMAYIPEKPSSVIPPPSANNPLAPTPII